MKCPVVLNKIWLNILDNVSTQGNNMNYTGLVIFRHFNEELPHGTQRVSIDQNTHGSAPSDGKEYIMSQAVHSRVD